MNESVGVLDDVGYDWSQRLDLVVAMMREMSTQTDPQEMRRAYTERMSARYSAAGSSSSTSRSSNRRGSSP